MSNCFIKSFDEIEKSSEDISRPTWLCLPRIYFRFFVCSSPCNISIVYLWMN